MGLYGETQKSLGLPYCRSTLVLGWFSPSLCHLGLLGFDDPRQAQYNLYGGLWEWSDLSSHSLVGSFKINFFFSTYQNLASSGAGMVASGNGLTCHVIP
jgi:hypothetical protein